MKRLKLLLDKGASLVLQYYNKTLIFKKNNNMILQYSSKSLKLEDGQELKYTHCIIAVGSLGPIPCRSTQVINIIKLFAHIHLFILC